MTTTVSQLVPSVVPGDATTSHALQVQRLLRAEGHRSEIYAIAVHPDLEDKVRLLGELSGPSDRGSFFVYQLSAYSELADFVIGRREQIAVNYHNVTPACFFRLHDPGIALAQYAAEVQVSQLARQSSFAVCDSQFNAEDIRGHGFCNAAVSPVLLDLEEFDAEPDPHTTRMLQRRREAGGAQFLCVGGIAPHKAQHELVNAFAVYRRIFDPRARLSLVGRTMAPGYGSALGALISSLGLEEAIDVPGGITHPQLVAYFRGADALVSVSRHEGFCVPLLEAMYLGVPVIAHRAGAVEDTLGEGGLLIEDRAPGALAVAMWRVVSDADLRTRLIQAADSRVRNFSLDRTRASMSRVLRQWMQS